MKPDAVQTIRGARIAQLIESDGPGGAERMLIYLASELQAGGCYCLVILPARGEGWLAREVAAAGLPMEPFDQRHPVSPSSARWLEATFRKHRITLAHSHEFTMAVYGAWSAWRTGIPHVITMHGGRYYANRLRRRLALRAAVALSTQTVAVSQELAAHLSRDLWISPSRVLSIPNGVPRGSAGQPRLREELGLAPDDRLILAVGNLYPVKGHRYLIEALALLTNRDRKVHIAIAGRGELAETLRVQARALGVADRLHLLGFRSDIPDLLAAAEVFVLPSLSEGLPMALLEAMFARRPIVASDVGALRAALAGGEAGLLVQPGDPQVLAGALDRLLANPADAQVLAERAARRAAMEYDSEVMAARYACVYKRALQEPTPRAG